MRSLLPVLLILAVITGSSCNKSEGDTPVHCEGLVTDTSGTGDNAKIFMPNAFTPNSDGLNDIIKPYTLNIASIKFVIYDESYTEVFSTSQLGQGWSTSIPANTSIKYYYKIQAVTITNHQIGSCGEVYKLSCRPGNAPTLYFEDQLTINGFTGVTNESLIICP